MRFVYVFLLIGSIQAINAGIVGDPVIERQFNDTATGILYAYDGTFATAGNIQTWSFYAGSTGDPHDVTGQQITPVILDQSTSGGWTVTGIGTTQTVPGPGSYTFNFDLVSGSAAVGPTLTFGWYDGSATASNQGTISVDPASTAVGFRNFLSLAFPVVGTPYVTNSDFTGPNSGSDWGSGSGRIYSVQFDSLDSTDPSTAPEPSSLAMLFAGAVALLACKRRR